MVLVIAAAVSTALTFHPSAANRDAPLQWILPSIFGAAVLIGSFFEWRSSRHEASLDKFYDRLCIVNESREKIWLEDEEQSELWTLRPVEGSAWSVERYSADTQGRRIGKGRPHVDPMQMYVWRELDNLEYLLERYRLGYLSTRLAFRGVATFASRFLFENFRETLGEPELLRLTAYNWTTVEVVKSVAAGPEEVLRKCARDLGCGQLNSAALPGPAEQTNRKVST